MMVFVLIAILAAASLSLAVRQIAKARSRQYRDEVAAFEFADQRQRQIRPRAIGPLASGLRSMATRRRRINQAHAAAQNSPVGHR
jgi:cytolysin (calcineurin-like family phosphatase)